jgi:hypothetical protein
MWEGGARAQAEYVGHTLDIDAEVDPEFARTGRAAFRLRWTKAPARR